MKSKISISWGFVIIMESLLKLILHPEQNEHKSGKFIVWIFKFEIRLP